ncbi:hypothetical protein EPO34_04135 [Patescibacteria group bacterium]|nr:MAG: hypothetical protein EPO34_04135 [Patescibacteria group bacterium]
MLLGELLALRHAPMRRAARRSRRLAAQRHPHDHAPESRSAGAYQRRGPERVKDALKKLFFWRTTTAAAVVSFLLALGAAVVTSAVWAQSYDGRIAPRVSIGSVPVGGLTREEAVEAVQRAVDRRLAEGVPIDLDGRHAVIPLITFMSGDTTEDVTFDVSAGAEAALAYGRSESPALDVLLLMRARLFGPMRRIDVPVALTRENVETNVRAAFPDLEIPFKEASFSFTEERDGWQADVVEGAVGRTFDFDTFVPRLTEALRSLSPAPVRLSMTAMRPTIEAEAVRMRLEQAENALARAPFPFKLEDAEQGTEEHPVIWSMNAAKLSRMLVPRLQDGYVFLGVDEEAFGKELDELAKVVEIPARNARFQIVDGKVSEFATSQAGRAIDRRLTQERFESDLNDASVGVFEEGRETSIVLIDTEPSVQTSQGDDLGIVAELGTGTSSFKGSPKNRIKNIKNGVKLLNGLLIAPDETFSLINALKPFDAANGYLAELVIKGDKITPELGGGLCQIGTTTFRTIMNSGLPVVERRNHSLVISYYGDPSNGNPGTDATIYEPAPDLKFTNDTGHYVLFQAFMDETKQTLDFHFWGTSDGRKGSYTPPKVIRWIPFGDQVDTPTESLPAGEQQCQSPHNGADTTFLYTIARPDGTEEQTEFASHYRPLPKICLVGTGASSVEAPTGAIDAGGAVTAPPTVTP